MKKLLLISFLISSFHINAVHAGSAVGCLGVFYSRVKNNKEVEKLKYLINTKGNIGIMSSHYFYKYDVNGADKRFSQRSQEEKLKHLIKERTIRNSQNYRNGY